MPINVTTQQSLSPEMKTFYNKNLIRLAKPALVHAQFGQKRVIPLLHGKEIEFRRFNPLGKSTVPLTEGVTPAGQTMAVTKLLSTLRQFGGYVESSDLLSQTAIDNTVLQATELLADQAGRSLDTVIRDVITAGTNVQYGDGSRRAMRSELVGGDSTAANNDYLTVDCIRRAVRYLKTQNARKINGDYVGIIHPDAAYDLMNDPKWVNVKTYSDPIGIYQGEIGRIEGVRFVESTEAKIFHAEDLSEDSRTLTVASINNKVVTLSETLTSDEVSAIIGRQVIIHGEWNRIAAATTTTLTLKNIPVVTIQANDIIYPGEAGSAGRDVYATLILGADAYGVTELEGEGLKMIIKQLGSGGTADPLNQRNTVAWKADMSCVRLVEPYMIRIETASTFESGSN